MSTHGHKLNISYGDFLARVCAGNGRKGYMRAGAQVRAWKAVGGPCAIFTKDMKHWWAISVRYDNNGQHLFVYPCSAPLS